ncbi:hypothetical protein BC830DRAFT_1133167 [Chytriomyces sp. MP71]|nr:hypothetical protein BC830DRAFT_1133167 [Chytriomyces sp. MP71]
MPFLVAARTVPASFEKALECPITRKPFQDPVVTCEGQTYERSVIEAWFFNTPANEYPLSPHTLRPMASRLLIPNHALRNAMQLRTQEHGATVVIPADTPTLIPALTVTNVDSFAKGCGSQPLSLVEHARTPLILGSSSAPPPSSRLSISRSSSQRVSRISQATTAAESVEEGFTDQLEPDLDNSDTIASTLKGVKVCFGDSSRDLEQELKQELNSKSRECAFLKKSMYLLIKERDEVIEKLQQDLAQVKLQAEEDKKKRKRFFNFSFSSLR